MVSKLFHSADGWMLQIDEACFALEGERIVEFFRGGIGVDHLVAASRQGPRAAGLPDALRAPVLEQEIWAAGVTYKKSREARLEESKGQSLYSLVYDADRPQIFFKSFPSKVVGPQGNIGIRRDATWTVPEPELVVVFNAKGEIIGYTLGNDVSSRDIEGENALYQPQAKVYKNSCAIGPCIVLAGEGVDPLTWILDLTIERAGKTLFEGTLNVGNLHRALPDLGATLFSCQEFPEGAMLLTGTGLVPPADYTMQQGDVIAVSCSDVGALRNVAGVVG